MVAFSARNHRKLYRVAEGHPIFERQTDEHVLFPPSKGVSLNNIPPVYKLSTLKEKISP
jgi:hypothetical protein